MYSNIVLLRRKKYVFNRPEFNTTTGCRYYFIQNVQLIMIKLQEKHINCNYQSTCRDFAGILCKMGCLVAPVFTYMAIKFWRSYECGSFIGADYTKGPLPVQ